MSSPVRPGATPASALAGVRVLEYTEMASASFCARLLGDAGADVVKVEPPEGDRHRRHGPFPDGLPDPESSGMFLYLNSNKRGVALSLLEPPQKAAFDELVARADILVVGGQSTELEREGLRREAVQHLNPGIIVAAITPFGLSGPNSNYLGDELTCVAAGGLSFATPGVPDGVQDPTNEPPLSASTPLGELMTGVQGSAACVAALLGRQLNGQGCEIDLSLQEGVAAVMPYELAHAAYHEAKTRTTPGFALMPNVYMPCKDGYVVIMAVLDGHWRRLMEAAGNPDWADLEVFATARERSRNWDALEPLLLEWTMSHTGMEIAQLAQERGVPCFPAYTVGQMMNSPHVTERKFLQDFTSPGGRHFKLPGYPIRMGATPWRSLGPAPRLGQHTAEVLCEWLGWSESQAGSFPESPLGQADAASRQAGRAVKQAALPLQGVRVADFGQVIAAPVTAQMLGWLGAEVILVETESRFTTRVWPPFADGEPGIDRSGGFNLVNNNKLSCSLDLSRPDALEIARGIIGVSDVLVENYATGVMDRLGLGYEEVKKLRPDIIYMSLGAFGRSGPFKEMTGFHSVINLFSGLAAVTGHPGSHPRIMGGLIPDAFSGCYGVLAILEALFHRSRTGEGQFIEVSMTEALTGMIPEAVMEYSLTGSEHVRTGNRHHRKVPHNVFRCLGEDKWVAISVETDLQFRALAEAARNPGWADDSRFATLSGRQDNLDALEALVEQWTAGLDVGDVVATLQAAGVPAAPVFDSAEVLADPHLLERGFVAHVEHAVAGTRPVLSLPWASDGRRVDHLRAAPTFGEHNHWVLKQLLQVPDDEYARLVSSGAIA